MIDGVYRELTAMRTQIPFLEAFKKKQAQEAGGVASPPKPASSRPQTELRPKTMSESFHRVVSYVAHDGDLVTLTICSFYP
jgi:acyl-coenzyme A thioesterase 9